MGRWAVWSIHVKLVLLIMRHRWPPLDHFVLAHPDSVKFALMLKNPITTSLLEVTEWCQMRIQTGDLASWVSEALQSVGVYSARRGLQRHLYVVYGGSPSWFDKPDSQRRLRSFNCEAFQELDGLILGKYAQIELLDAHMGPLKFNVSPLVKSIRPAVRTGGFNLVQQHRMHPRVRRAMHPLLQVKMLEFFMAEDPGAWRVQEQVFGKVLRSGTSRTTPVPDDRDASKIWSVDLLQVCANLLHVIAIDPNGKVRSDCSASQVFFCVRPSACRSAVQASRLPPK